MSSTDRVLELVQREYGLPVKGIELQVERTTGALFKIGVHERGPVWLRIGGVANRTEHEFELEGQCASRLAAKGVPVSSVQSPLIREQHQSDTERGVAKAWHPRAIESEALHLVLWCPALSAQQLQLGARSAHSLADEQRLLKYV